ncbi:hypothetical protein G7Y89_g11765 [Cudoniella acicularis]|uniref:Uncharacterized protein n=1 Tax=Cudoniella acicularis TaxID=354080 RepID=A0A8H4RCV5_9HELO|nr:hypothetical protein G7Y89_g11765 [Cudoniella acicularis]
MAPERKHQQSVNRHKPSKNPQNEGAANVSNVADSQKLSTHRDTLTSTQLQPSTPTTFQYLPRPWTKDTVNSNSNANVNGATPMERWQNERIDDQPWHAIEGVYLHDGGDLDMTQQDNNTDNERRDGLAEDVDSMAYHTSGV